MDAHGEIQRVLRQAAEPDACFYGIKFTDIGLQARESIETAVKKELEYKRLYAPRPQNDVYTLKKIV